MLKNIKQRVRASGREPSFVDAEALALNFSFVLHERSDSPAVAQHVAAAAAHAKRIATTSPEQLSAMPLIGADELVDMRPSLILTATLGIPLVLHRLIESSDNAAALLFTDHAAGSTARATFFRAEASLTLPAGPNDRLAVAAVAVRPGDRTLEVAAHGPFKWPEDRENVLQALEDVVRDCLPQWHPLRALWDLPAEALLPEFGGTEFNRSVGA